MIDVTETAKQKLVSYLASNNFSSVLRVALMKAGSAWETLGLAIDDGGEGDYYKSFDKLTVCIERGLLEQCGSVTIDFVESGARSAFSIRSSNPMPRAGVRCVPGSGCYSNNCGC